jgi:hypothetical protein
MIFELLFYGFHVLWVGVSVVVWYLLVTKCS